MSRIPRLFVVSGPSGVGKGTLVALVRQKRPDLALTVSATTRKPRAYEHNGDEYYFLSDEEFDSLVATGEFIEWAHVHDRRYGTLRSEVQRLLAQDRSIILEVDVQGALNLREAYPDALLIFVEPPSLKVLEQRLRDRGSDDENQIKLRLANAASELLVADQYDTRIVNDDLDEASDKILAFIEAHESK
ncbi:MAG: guanylate kinase [Atopobiaceae bacterium]|nr:guanylate kinase [Atopobiaceae bacterium]